jgi:hypothetical protein
MGVRGPYKQPGYHKVAMAAFAVTPDELLRIKLVAQAAGVSVSAWLRSLVRQADPGFAKAAPGAGKED